MIISFVTIAFILLISPIILISSSPGIAFASETATTSPLPEGTPRPSPSAVLSMIWSKTYASPGQDEAYSVIQVSDGYVLAGHSGNDAYLVKADLDGNKVWHNNYGGKGDDEARSVIAVDNGYVIAGSSKSYENGGVSDVYLFKTGLYGEMKWYKTYQSTLNGHLTDAFGRSVIATKDGYVIIGETYADKEGGLDIFLIKTDLEGNLVWDKTIGGDAAEHGTAVISVPDGYIIAGDTYSYGNSQSLGVASSDVYLAKTDLNGTLVWNRTFGGKYAESANALVAVDDGYVVIGSTNSHSNSKDYDVYIVKADIDGNLIWSKHYGEADNDEGKSAIPVTDGYVITGYTSSTGNFYKDAYLLKTDLDGNLVWDRSYGGSDMDVGNSIIQARDGYVIAGYSCTYGIYTADYYLLKVASDTVLRPTVTAIPGAPTAMPSSMPAEGGLTSTDMVIIAVVIIVLIAIVGTGVAALYFYFPKK